MKLGRLQASHPSGASGSLSANEGVAPLSAPPGTSVQLSEVLLLGPRTRVGWGNDASLCSGVSE